MSHSRRGDAATGTAGAAAPVPAAPAVHLRDAAAGDFPLLKRWLDRPEVHRWLDPSLRGDRFGPLQHQLLLARREANRLWIACADGEATGVVGLTGMDAETRTAEIWYALGAPGAGGRGVATRAVAAALAHAFEELSLEAVRASVATENERSIRLLRRLGFRDAGRWRRAFRLGEASSDRLWFDLTLPEWRAGAGERGTT